MGSDVAEAGRGTQGTNISHLWTRKIIFKIAHLAGAMLVARRVRIIFGMYDHFMYVELRDI